MIVQELYTPKPLAVNSSTVIYPANSVCAFGGFICTTAGNFNLQDASGTDIIPAIGVTAGQQVGMSCVCSNGMKVVLSGGCIGTLFHNTVA